MLRRQDSLGARPTDGGGPFNKHGVGMYETGLKLQGSGSVGQG